MVPSFTVMPWDKAPPGEGKSHPSLQFASSVLRELHMGTSPQEGCFCSWEGKARHFGLWHSAKSICRKLFPAKWRLLETKQGHLTPQIASSC